MNLSFIEYEPQKVLEAFRRGEFDGLEVIGQADERDFFHRCFQEHLLEKLADSMPSVRKKREVPQWFILAANLSLKLHQENSFLAFERVVRCGGLLAALPPELAEKHLDVKSRQWALNCQGFNHKNSYDRATPCDQDTLRKALKDVSATAWLEWFNGAVQQVFQSYGFFEPEGLFIGDGSYLFVPDNPAYEGSVVMWFDEHNHPVDYETLSPEQRQHAHLERCYKWVSLLHLRAGAHVYAGAALLPGNAHEVGPFFKLVEQFVQTIGKGVIKWLVLDRGFIDGAQICVFRALSDSDSDFCRTAFQFLSDTVPVSVGQRSGLMSDSFPGFPEWCPTGSEACPSWPGTVSGRVRNQGQGGVERRWVNRHDRRSIRVNRERQLMAQIRVTMRQIQEILRLKHQNQLSVREIARSCGLPTSTVGDYAPIRIMVR